MADGIFDTIKGRLLHLLGDADCQNLTVRGRIRRASGQLYYPTGVIQPWPSAAIPNGAIAIVGQTITAAQYPVLVAMLAPGAASYTLPDWRGRTLIGAGAGPGLTNRVLGTAYGSEDLKTHNHNHSHGGGTGIQNANHTHSNTIARGTSGGYGLVDSGTATSSGFVPPTAGQSNDHSHGIGADATNAGTGADNLQPSYATNWIIWT